MIRCICERQGLVANTGLGVIPIGLSLLELLPKDRSERGRRAEAVGRRRQLIGGRPGGSRACAIPL
jgi:hypothetical protein